MDNNTFTSFKYKARLLENSEADGVNGILSNTTIALPLKHISNFWRSFEMPLINWKVDLKLKWMKHCVLSANGNHNDNANSNNIIFTLKEKSYMSLSSLY